MGRTLNSLYRERRTMKNIALLSLLTLAILQPLAEAQRGLLGRLALRSRGSSGLTGVEDQRVVSSVDSAYGREALNATASFGKGGTRIGNGLTETYIDSRPNCKVFSISCIGSGKGQQRCVRGNPPSVLFEVSSNGDVSCIIQMP